MVEEPHRPGLTIAPYTGYRTRYYHLRNFERRSTKHTR